MSGGAPAFDSSNNLYVVTGNGDYDGKSDFGDSFLKLTSGLVLQDGSLHSSRAHSTRRISIWDREALLFWWICLPPQFSTF